MAKEIGELIEQLKTQQATKLDLIVPSTKITMLADGKLVIPPTKGMEKAMASIGVTATEHNMFQTGKLMHAQFSEKLGIPKTYYDRMLGDNPQLMALNVNSWLQKQTAKNYMLRTFIANVNDDTIGYGRALLSDRFKPIDNFDVLMATLEAIKATGVKVEIESCDLTEKRMYVRVICPEIQQEATELLKNYRTPEGETGNPYVNTGFILSNSEVGHGTFSISPRLFIQVCKNGLIQKNDSYKKTHLGAKLDEESIIEWSGATRQANLALVIQQVKDAVSTYMSKEYLTGTLSKLEAKGIEQIEHPVEAVNNMCGEYGFDQQKTKDILDFFIKGGQQTAFGLSQAVTYYAHKSTGDNADDRFDMEMIGNDIIHRAKDFDKVN